MGAPSLSILMHELFKLLSYAKATDVTIIRIGTCGGLGVAPGSVVVSSGALNSALQPVYTQHVLGKAVDRPITVEQELVSAIVNCNSKETSFQVISGLTMSCNDFYEEQGRVDGYFCEHTVEERAEFLGRCHEMGVRNIEMEACAFLAFCCRANVKAAVVCVAYLDRLKGGQVTSHPEELAQFDVNCISAVFNFIKHKQGHHRSGG
jgi:uridine phosphorylase